MRLDPNTHSAQSPMYDDEPVYVDCGSHGKRVAAVVCCHMLQSSEPVGFIENSSDPDDLQARCERCMEMFLAEGDKTAAFCEFNDRTIVCRACYSSWGLCVRSVEADRWRNESAPIPRPSPQTS
jgi:hypothetical protein